MTVAAFENLAQFADSSYKKHFSTYKNE
jgi:hypothetical protein